MKTLIGLCILLALLLGQACATELKSIEAADSLGSTPIPLRADIKGSTSTIESGTIITGLLIIKGAVMTVTPTGTPPTATVSPTVTATPTVIDSGCWVAGDPCQADRVQINDWLGFNATSPRVLWRFNY